MFLYRHRDEIIKFQSEILDLRNEVCVRQNEISVLKDEIQSEISNLKEADGIKQNEFCGLKETPCLAVKEKKRCKDLLIQAFLSEVRFGNFYCILPLLDWAIQGALLKCTYHP